MHKNKLIIKKDEKKNKKTEILLKILKQNKKFGKQKFLFYYQHTLKEHELQISNALLKCKKAQPPVNCRSAKCS